MPEIRRSAHIVWDGTIASGEDHVSGGSGAFVEFPVTLASRAGTADGKGLLEELVPAAHATCFTMAMGSILAGEDTPPERLACTAICTLEEVDGSYTITSSELDVLRRVPGADAAAFERAVRAAEASCPVSRALTGSVSVRSHIRLVPTAAAGA
jgi:osmotically inducible protein OsmC